MLTKKQKPVLDFIRKYMQGHGYAPSLEEIRKHFKLASVSTAHFYVQKLSDLGYLEKKDGPRAINVFEKEALVRVPVIGTIAAGEPIYAFEEHTETLAIPRSKLSYKEDLFGLRVAGDSMVDENIDDGDIVLVHRQSTADNGDKVVALNSENEATLKKLYREKGRIRLQPANSKMPPLYFNPKDLIIQGKVISVIKSAK